MSQMLPSMPILFTRESQDGFFIEPEASTSFFNRHSKSNIVINPKPTSQKLSTVPSESMVTQKDTNELNDYESGKHKLPENAMETALVRSYYTKVQSRFSSNQTVSINKFVQFINILRSFDPSKETPVDLYRKMETLFGDDHKDILEDFLLFLKPGQAAEVGRFMDHFKLTHMISFIEALQTTLSRKPTVLRKVLRALATGMNSDNSEQMKARVLPHLRSSPRLIQMFKSLFPDERPPDSIYETGADILNESIITNDKGYDVWEFDEKNDNKRKLDVKENLDTVYLHGRVFLQHGRILKTARVLYPYSKEPYRVHARRLAPPHCHLSPSESDDEASSSKKNNKSINQQTKTSSKRPRKQKSPTKNIKDVNDNTKHKDSTTSNVVVSSPKTVKGKSNLKTKVKDKSEHIAQKRDKKEKFDIKSDQKKDEASKAKQPKIEVSTEDKKSTVTIKIDSGNSWTREEDKTMLQLLKGESVTEHVFVKIQDLLPHRSVTEIKERFYHVMNLLQQMAVGQVT